MSDGLFYGMAIIVVFLVWLAGGGVHRPISFSGPFITPIVNESSTQAGYGPALGGKISAAGVTVGIHVPTTSSNTSSGSSAVRSASPTIVVPTNSSPYAGKVFLAHYVNGTQSANPANEYLSISVSIENTQPIDITGWQLKSTVTGAIGVIPAGVAMVNTTSVTPGPIMMQPNSTATIYTGTSPLNISYEENACTSYLQDAPEYNNCYAEKSAAPGFLTNNWRIFLKHPSSRLWKNSGDTIELLDNSGRVVDSFSN